MAELQDQGRGAGRSPVEGAPERVSHLSPERFRVMVSYVLTIGITISAAVIALGFLLAIIFGWRTSLVGGARGSSDLAGFSDMWSGLRAVRPVAITQLGLALLLATPVVRVAASVVGFALEEDRLYVVITLMVLAILLGSIFLIR